MLLRGALLTLRGIDTASEHYSNTVAAVSRCLAAVVQAQGDEMEADRLQQQADEMRAEVDRRLGASAGSN
jgi:hypothetical protein